MEHSKNKAWSAVIAVNVGLAAVISAICFVADTVRSEWVGVFVVMQLSLLAVTAVPVYLTGLQSPRRHYYVRGIMLLMFFVALYFSYNAYTCEGIFCEPFLGLAGVYAVVLAFIAAFFFNAGKYGQNPNDEFAKHVAIAATILFSIVTIVVLFY